MNMRIRRTKAHAFIAIIALVALPAFAHPGSGICVMDNGQVFFVDTGYGIWKIDESGDVSSYAQADGHFLTEDPHATFVQEHFAHLERGDIKVISEKPNVIIATSYPVAVGSDGAFYYPQVQSKGRVKIMRMLPGKKAQQFAALPPVRERSYTGEWVDAEWVWAIAAGPNGSIYYTEKHAVRKIAVDGTVSAVAENVTVPGCEHPPAVTESHVEPGLYGLCVTDDGTVYVAASACSALLKIAPDGTQSVALRATDGWSPQGVDAVGNTLYVLEYDYVKSEDRADWLPRVRKIDADGKATVISQIDKPMRAAAAKK